MKKILVLWIVFISSILISKSQNPGFNIPLGDDMDKVVDMIWTSDGNLLLAGVNSSNLKVFITKINTSGETLWTNYYNGNMTWYANLLENHDGNILVPMNFNMDYAAILELSPQGDSLGCLLSTSSKVGYFSDILELNDSGFLATNILYDTYPYFYPDSTYLVRISPSLEITEKIPSPFMVVQGLKLIAGDELIATVNESNPYSTSIVRMNMQGQSIWTINEDELSANLINLLQMNENSFLAFGWTENPSTNSVIARFDSDGVLDYSNVSSGSFINSVVRDPVDDLIYALNFNEGKCEVMTVNNSGEVISTYIADDSLETCILLMDDEYFYVAGFYSYPEGAQGRLLKFNKNKLYSVGENRLLHAFSVYPNPAENIVRFELTSLKNQYQKPGEAAFVTLFDVYGREVYRTELEDGNAVWNCGQVARGMYFYSINFDNIICSGKLLLE